MKKTIQTLSQFAIVFLLAGCSLNQNVKLHEACAIVDEIGYVYKQVDDGIYVSSKGLLADDKKIPASRDTINKLQKVKSLVKETQQATRDWQLGTLVEFESTRSLINFCKGKESFATSKTIDDYPKGTSLYGILVWVVIGLLSLAFTGLLIIVYRRMKQRQVFSGALDSLSRFKQEQRLKSTKKRISDLKIQKSSDHNNAKKELENE